MKHIIMYSICIFVFSNALQGQPIDELIDEMKMQNSHLLSLDKQSAASVFNADQIIKYPDLKITAGVGLFPVETRLGAQRFALGAMQMLPTKGVYDAKRQIAMQQSEVISEKRNISTLLIEEQIKLSYHEIQFLELKRENLKKKINQLQTLTEIAQINIRSGKGSLSDLIIVQRQIQMQKADLELIDAEKEQYVIRINGLLERDLTTPIVADLSEWENTQGSEEFNPDEHPTIRMLNKMKSVSDAKVHLSDLDNKYEFSVGLNYAYISARDEVNISNNGRDVLMPTASVKIPLSKSHINAKRQEEKLIKEALDHNIRSQVMSFQTDRSSALSRINLAMQTKTKFQNLIETSKDIVELMKTEYATEGRKFEELLRVELEILDYQLAQHKQQLIIRKAITVLEKYNI